MNLLTVSEMRGVAAPSEGQDLESRWTKHDVEVRGTWVLGWGTTAVVEANAGVSNSSRLSRIGWSRRNGVVQSRD
jgi:hypothetical protein